jgi:hypothetical protein
MESPMRTYSALLFVAAVVDPHKVLPAGYVAK